mmetsp:Transcript_25303/g.81829  ORF Transcript_25303/g.81829 Transcript_25303/m.81829 type:complete len:91 (-) Transcript_25303:392-664(-)
MAPPRGRGALQRKAVGGNEAVGGNAAAAGPTLAELEVEKKAADARKAEVLKKQGKVYEWRCGACSLPACDQEERACLQVVRRGGGVKHHM